MEFETYIRFILALIFVIALIGLLAWAARRFGVARNAPHVRGKDRRLAVVEMAMLDSKHRLVLVRRDKTEHLLLLGATGELVVETGIPAKPEADGDTAK